MTEEDHLTRAAASVFERICQDKARVGKQVLSLLECMESNLFNPDCNVNFLKRSVGIRENSVVIKFHSDLGTPPREYLETCRMETAAGLLLDSRLPIWKIGKMVGYLSLGVFGRAFSRWAGLLPTVYRKSHGVTKASAPSNGLILPTVRYLNRAITGNLKPDEAEALIAHLQTLYPQSQRPPEMMDRPAEESPKGRVPLHKSWESPRSSPPANSTPNPSPPTKR